MRLYLYLIAGLTSALLGWSIGHFFLSDLNIIKILPYPEIVLFPSLAISLSVGMVLNEIFISNPTRFRLSCKKSLRPLFLSLVTGAAIGLIGGILALIFYLPIFNIATNWTRVLSWLLLGATVGLSEGLTWILAKYDQSQKRLHISLTVGSLAGLAIGLILELFRQKITESFLATLEDIIGFAILGTVLALVLSLTFSPSYLSALRAGSGFEYTTNQSYNDDYPKINNPILKFVNKNQGEKIEEGLSIGLPNNNRSVKVKIGSAPDDDIYLPGIPPSLAIVNLERRSTFLVPAKEHLNLIYINGTRLTSDEPVLLKHNYLVSFTNWNNNGKKVYRFVFYNRFLDPQA